MTRHPLRRPAALAAGAAVLVLAGCGASHGTSGTGTSAGKSGCGDAVLDLAAIPAGDVCVGVGRTLTVRLAPGKGAPAASGGALTRVGPDVFRGAEPGRAELTGSWTCPPAKPGEMRCLMVGTWRATVEVR